jgi:hypothetical protein
LFRELFRGHHRFLGSCKCAVARHAGTIEGTVVDQSGASIPRAQVRLTNAVSGYTQTVTSGQDGSFRLVNIPPNPYYLEVTASGFGVSTQDISIRNATPVPDRPS